MQNLISIQQISHIFKNHKTELSVLEDINLELKSGEVVAILAPSGAGKSTLLKIIAGLLTPTKGEISINGFSPKQAINKKMIAYAFQESALLDWKTVWQNIQLPNQIGNKILNKQELAQRTNDLLRLVNLETYRDFYPSQLSGGMKQRVSLARMLLLNPNLLLLDEPFTSLDLLTRTKLLVEFSKIIAQTQIPCILVSHNIDECVFLANRVYTLSPRPAKILKMIEVPSEQPRNEKLFDDLAFLKLVADCRAELLKHWQE